MIEIKYTFFVFRQNDLAREELRKIILSYVWISGGSNASQLP